MNNIKSSYKDKQYLILDIKDNIYFSNVENLNQNLADTGIENIAITMTTLDNVSQEKMIYIGEDRVKQLDVLPQLLAGDEEALIGQIWLNLPPIKRALKNDRRILLAVRLVGVAVAQACVHGVSSYSAVSQAYR